MTMDQFAVVAFTLLSFAALAGVIYPFRPFGKRWRALLVFVGSTTFLGFLVEPPAAPAGTVQAESPAPQPSPAPVSEPSRMWVAGERLARRTCPSEGCGIVGQYFFREAADVIETRDGWARVTQPYDASCNNGRSEYVDEGPADCTAANGITDGRFAEWVRLDGLVAARPADPAEGATGFAALVGASDDFQRYGEAFAKAAQELIEARRCTAGDFRENGGFVKSSNHRNEPIYFIYCGGATVGNRLYLNAATGEVFR